MTVCFVNTLLKEIARFSNYIDRQYVYQTLQNNPDLLNNPELNNFYEELQLQDAGQFADFERHWQALLAASDSTTNLDSLADEITLQLQNLTPDNLCATNSYLVYAIYLQTLAKGLPITVDHTEPLWSVASQCIHEGCGAVIVDVLGQEKIVQQVKEKEFILDTSNLPEGQYLVRAQNNIGSYLLKKLVVVR